jgi:hypothetical protein
MLSIGGDKRRPLARRPHLGAGREQNSSGYWGGPKGGIDGLAHITLRALPPDAKLRRRYRARLDARLDNESNEAW